MTFIVEKPLVGIRPNPALRVQRLDRSVDVETIAWIWDESCVLGKNGRDYAERFRPVEPFGEIHLDTSGNPYENVDVGFSNETKPETDEP